MLLQLAHCSSYCQTIISYVYITDRLEKKSLSVCDIHSAWNSFSWIKFIPSSHGHQLSGAGTKRPKVSGTSHGTPQCLMDHQSSTSHDAEKTSTAAPARIASLQTAAATRRTRTRTRTNKNIKVARTKQRTSRGSDPDGTLLSSRLGQEHFFFCKQHRRDLDLLNPSMQPIPACDSNIIGRYDIGPSPFRHAPTPKSLQPLRNSSFCKSLGTTGAWRIVQSSTSKSLQNESFGRTKHCSWVHLDKTFTPNWWTAGNPWRSNLLSDLNVWIQDGYAGFFLLHCFKTHLSQDTLFPIWMSVNFKGTNVVFRIGAGIFIRIFNVGVNP